MLFAAQRLIPLVSLPVLACGSSIDGKYYNAWSGEYAMELKNGKVTWAQGLMEGMKLRYEVKGDSLYIIEEGGDRWDDFRHREGRHAEPGNARVPDEKASLGHPTLSATFSSQ